MANILYGVNGEGAGHSSRCKEVITHLIERGHRVHVVSFDRGLKNLAPFFEVTEIYGLRFAYVNNRVRYGKTVAKNLLTAPRAARSLHKLASLADEWQIEMVFTDFEPLSCHFGRRRRLPVVSIDNQHCLTNAEVSYPRKYGKEAAAAKLVTRLMTPHADAYLATSFFDAAVRKANTWLVPPIVRREVLGVRPSSEGHILVYVTSPSPQLVKVLRGVRARFVCYGFDRSGSEGNLLFKKPSLDGFLADLASCQAIIANSGFSLVSEALHLAKPYLACPVERQFEQIFNAYYLQKFGYGAYWEQLTRECVESFLYNLPVFRENLARYARQDNSALFKRVDELVSRL